MVFVLIIIWLFWIAIYRIYKKLNSELEKYSNRTDKFTIGASVIKHSYDYYKTVYEIADILMMLFLVLLIYLTFQVIFGN